MNFGRLKPKAMSKIGIIVRKRILLNLLDHKNILAYLFLILFSVTSFFISIENYKSRLLLYNTSRNNAQALADSALVNTYSQIKLGIEKRPNEIEIYSAGIGEKFGSSAVVFGKYGPTVIRSRDKENIFLPSGGYDVMYFIGILVSLMAIFITYDIISSEREGGTLALTLASSLKKHEIISGELLAAVLSLAIPLGISFIIMMIISAVSIGLDSMMISAFAVYLLLSVFVSTVFSLLGILSSALNQRSLLSLLVGFLLWISFVLIIPISITWIARYTRYVPPLAELNSSDIVMYNSPTYVPAKSSALLPDKLKEMNLRQRYQQSIVEKQLRLLSPFSSFLQCSQIIAGTDLDSHMYFREYIERTEDQLIRWQENKIKEYPGRESYYEANWGPLDMEGLPSADFRDEDIQSRFRRALPYLISLSLFGIVLFYLTFVVFLRYDPRWN